MRPPRGLALAVALVLAAGACVEREDLDAPWSARELEAISSLVLGGAAPPQSPGNRHADDPAAALLGRALFFDPKLSEDAQLSCASCHLPEHYFQDGLRTARGRNLLPRNTPSLVGAAHFTFFTWDGRRDSHWAQALDPLEAPREMGASRTHVARRVAAAHARAYQEVFGPLPPVEDEGRFPAAAGPAGGEERTPEQVAWAGMREEDRQAATRVFVNVGKALEAYQRRLWPQPSDFDRYAQALLGGDLRGGNHLSSGARRGLRLFIGQGRCIECHHGPLLTDRQFHNLGLPRPKGVAQADPGRAEGALRVKQDPFRCGSRWSDSDRCEELEFLDPAFEDFAGAFRTPSLRNVARTGPYMHGGQMLTLEEVVEFYKRLPGQPEVGHRDLILRRLGPTFPTRDLVLFLRALTGPLPPDLEPRAQAGPP